jgi:methionyl-tRNA formyltransferase
LNIIFAGTPWFARCALEAIHAGGHEVRLVLTQPDRPSGRGMRLAPSPVKEYALANGIPVLQPASLRPDGRYPEEARAAQQVLRTSPHDVMVVAAYGLILPPSVLENPHLGCLNIHASLLPRWRGAAPIQRAIEAGDATTGITIMRMAAGLDTGPMLLQEPTPIGPEETAGELQERLAAIGSRLILAALSRLGAGPLPGNPQPDAGVTYATKITRQEGRLDFTRPAADLARQVRAFNPQPGTFTEYRGTVLKIWRASACPGGGLASPGTVLSTDHGTLAVACGSGVLEISEIQKPGAVRLSASAFLKGFSFETGAVLS